MGGERIMAQEYKITKVSQQPPNEWKGPHGTVYYIKVQLEGHIKPVSVGKKAPDALKAGYTIYGTIEPTDLPEDKFKSEQKPEYQAKPEQSPEYWSNKDSQIRAQWAIGQAVLITKGAVITTEYDERRIEEIAKALFSMVDRVKVVTDTKEKPLSDEDYQEQLGASFDNDGEINLADIPF